MSKEEKQNASLFDRLLENAENVVKFAKKPLIRNKIKRAFASAQENNKKIKHTSSGCLMRPARLFGYKQPGFRDSIIFTRIKTGTKGIFLW